MITQIKKQIAQMKIYQKGNLILEYSILIAIVIAALVSMQVYVKRALCGRWRQTGDVFGSGRQYEPNLTNTGVK